MTNIPERHTGVPENRPLTVQFPGNPCPGRRPDQAAIGIAHSPASLRTQQTGPGGMMKWLSIATLVALAAGISIGVYLGSPAGEALRPAAEIVEGIGRLWLNALRMTVIPLIVALLVTGVASVADAASTGRIAGRAVLVFGVLLVGVTTFAALVFPALFAAWPVPEDAARGFLAGVAGDAEPPLPPSFADWLAALAPSNVVSAASNDSVLQLVLFSIVFAFAATQLPTDQRLSLVGFFRSIAETMVIIVRWVLMFAPLGVFGLALGVGLYSGAGAAGVLLQYVVIVAGVTASITLIAIAVAVIWGRVNLLRFLTAAGPVMALAISTQSSLACLPAMVARCRDQLGVSERVADLVLPLAVTIFRITSSVANLGVALFIVHIYGMEIGVAQMIAAGFVALAVSVSSIGLPGQVSFFASIAPICLTLGAPIDLLAILVAVEVIPDIFRTLGNVTADMAAAVIVDRSKKPEDQPEVSAAA